MNMENAIKNKLIENFEPSLVEVKNNSGLHAGHAGDDGSGETHFAITIKSDMLKGLSAVNAHRKINAVLKDEFSQGLHALEIKIIK